MTFETASLHERNKAEGILISVITATWNLVEQNRSDSFLTAVQCVQDQTFRGIEHIIIDGDSRDGTQELIRKAITQAHQQAPSAIPIHYLTEPDSGLYDAMNKGVAAASGKYILFLNSDDTLAGIDVLRKLAELLEQNDPDFQYGTALEISADGKSIEHKRMNLASFLQRIPFCHNSMLVRKTLFESLNGHDLGYRVAADYDFVFRMLLSGAVGMRVNFPISAYSSRGVSANSNQLAEDYALTWQQHFSSLLPDDHITLEDTRDWFRIGQLPFRVCWAAYLVGRDNTILRNAAIHSFNITLRRRLQPWRRYN